MKRIASLLLSACLFSAEAGVGQSNTPTQITASNDTGTRAYETYSGAHENINLSNGNLSLNIPLVSLPGRNGLDMNLTFQYNSKMWVPHAVYGNGSDIMFYWREENGGWSYNIPRLDSGSYLTGVNGNPIGLTPFIITLPSGGKTSVECCNGVMDSQDGSFVTLYREAGTDFTVWNKPATLLMKDGTKIHFPCELSCNADQISDTSGNYISFGGSQITDTLGRQATFGDTASTETISSRDSDGNPQNVTLTFSNVTLFQTSGDPATNPYYTGPNPFQYPVPCTAFQCTKKVWVYPPGNNVSSSVLTRIDLPGNLSYTFSYNGYGELIKITYPTGGYTKYTYAAYKHGETFWIDASLNISSDFREVTSKRVCRNASGVCSPSEEDVTVYEAVIGDRDANNSSVDVKHFLDEANNIYEKTTYQFTNERTDVSDNMSQYFAPREIKRSTYAASGTLLRTVETTYTAEPDLYRRDGGLPTSVTTTLYDVTPPLVKRTDTIYDTYSPTVRWYPWSDYEQQSPQTRTRQIDNPLTQIEYDYGQNAAGPAMRTTNTTWLKWYWFDHLWNRPLTQEIQDAGGTRIAYTQFEYDNYDTAPIVSSGATHRLGFVEGNQTAVSRWRKSDGAMLTTRRQFDDAGNVVKVTDPGGHWTTFSFADRWNEATCAPTGGVAAAYPTKVSNQLGHTIVTKYNSCTGTVASQQDANQQTTITTYDALSRPLTVTYPDTGSTQYAYPSPTHTTIKKKPSSIVTDPGLWPTTELYSDGLGRTSQTASKNGEAASGWDVKTTCYDTRGYPSFSSYTAQVSAVPIESPCSLAGDSLQIDALGRATQLVHSDGATILTDYAGRATRVRDEGKDASGNRVTRVTQVDGLGRLTSVCEKTGTTQMGAAGAPAVCGQDIAETGFLTSYQYDLADPVGSAMQVLQSGLANRYFVYDSLGNLLKATNPESGTTQYSYNDDGTLHTKTRPKPNQQDPNTVVTTTYAYDELHRLKQTEYDDNSTASVYRLYDQASATTGQTLTQPVGRMTTLTTLGGQSVDLFSYDSMGRVIANWQCTPQQSCGVSMKQLAYNYDLLGNVTSASNGFGVNIGYGYNVAERLQTVTSSLSDATHPGTLMSNASYGPFGLTSANFGNGVQETRGYTSRAMLNSISDNVTITQPAIPGAGSVTLSGAERTIGGPPATVATGSVTLSGSEQSTQAVYQPAVSGSGSVSLSGGELNTQAVSNPGAPSQGSITISGNALRGYDDYFCFCPIYDSGTVTVTVGGAGGTTATAHYERTTNAGNVADQLAANLSRVGSPFIATSSGGVVTINSTSNPAGWNGVVVSVTQLSDRPDVFPDGSLALSTTNFSGGVDPTYYTLYDAGTVTATVNGFSQSTSYGQGSTLATVALGLASAFNGDGNSPVTVTASGTSLTLTSKATGAGTNYSLSASVGTSYPGYFPQPSFLAHAPVSSLLGGRDTTYRTLYDSGTIGITVNGITKSAPYDQNSTPAGLASSLASSFSSDPGAPVTATASGATLSLTTRATGASANYSLSSAGSTSQGDHFSHPSFSSSPSGANLTGGQDSGAAVSDTGIVSVTVNCFTEQVRYDQTSTASWLASALASAFNADSGSPVTASVSGGTITVTAKSGGVATNYALSASSTSNQSGFTGTSFPAATSAATLSGGTDSNQIPTTPYSVSLTFMPNGNVATANDNVNGNWTYGYDDFNRLSSSSKTGSAYTYDYDRYGNRWHQNGPVTNLLSFSNGNNRIDALVYDAAGNVLNDGQGHTFTYDAENRVIGMGSDVAYAYDGDGRRIRKTVSSKAVDYLYDLEDHVVTQISASGGWDRGEIFADGRHLATYAWSTTFFTHADWQGTERARTALSGAVSESCSSLPFGDAQSCVADQIISHDHFTGKERDDESGLDYFGARYYGSNLGRFMSPDWAAEPSGVPYADFKDPQSLNLYGYVGNNPVTRTDLNGHCNAGGEDHGFWWCVGHALGVTETKQERSTRIESERQQILNGGRHSDGSPLTAAERARLQHASQTKIDEYYNELKDAAEARRTQSENRQMMFPFLGENAANNWHQGSFESPEESLNYHFEKHGEEVGAASEQQYLEKAEIFKENLRGARKSPVEGATEGAVRYSKNGKYIDLSPDGKIISFGSL